ncbi:MAG: CoA-binding protein [Dehalococcoidia bacterium]
MNEVEEVLTKYRRVAVVGLSPKADRPSYGVASYLTDHGYEIVPVNPTTDQILGLKSYPDLHSIPGPVEVVDIFRRSEDVGPIVDDAIAIGAKAVWMQDGVVNEEAAEKARKAGLKVVMNACMMREHHHLTG